MPTNAEQPEDRRAGFYRLERAIGVFYRPERKRASHYFEAQLTHQFDAVIHIDETSCGRASRPGRRREYRGCAGKLPSGL